ncbi:MAG: hypothetical protein MAG795_00766 [Candidatus Woesearchaeota archaeon]|nr:hypothetical protein [Candidatus Woesearchaeota archaeon]
MNCSLCNAVNDDSQLITKLGSVCCIVNLEFLKKGHVMIVPKRHVENLSELTMQESKDILKLSDLMLNKIKNKYGEDPILLMHTGKHGSQSHIHIHILPTKAGLRRMVSKYENIPKRVKKSKEVLKHVADDLRF